MYSHADANTPMHGFVLSGVFYHQLKGEISMATLDAYGLDPKQPQSASHLDTDCRYQNLFLS